jgi:putative ABC transport system substrate-binding protein
MSYGESLEEVYRRAATYVDKILKGVKPADLPIEQPTKSSWSSTGNPRRPSALTIPPSVLLQADQVID